MKNYTYKLLKILVSDIRINPASDRGSPEIKGFLEAAGKINSLIQKEVSGLEEEIVRLTDQLMEDDSLLLERRGKRVNQYSY